MLPGSSEGSGVCVGVASGVCVGSWVGVGVASGVWAGVGVAVGREVGVGVGVGVGTGTCCVQRTVGTLELSKYSAVRVQPVPARSPESAQMVTLSTVEGCSNSLSSSPS